MQDGLGKHDGSYQGSQLFSCLPGRGSFAKAVGKLRASLLPEVEKVEQGVSIQPDAQAFTAYIPSIPGIFHHISPYVRSMALP